MPAPQYVSSLFDLLTRNQLGGLGFIAGVPRVTLGGALIQNFGAFGQSIDSLVLSVKAIINGNIVELSHPDCQFSYRSSIFKKTNLPVISAKLKLPTTAVSDFKEEIRQSLDFRRSHQPMKYPNIGSIFKNPEGRSAGQLIDEAGLRGYQIGDAQIWEGHANFIINKGKASFSEVLALINHIRSTILNKFDIELIPEICILQ